MPRLLDALSARRLLAALSVAALLMVLAASVSPEHTHQGTKQDSCVLCHAGAPATTIPVVAQTPALDVAGTLVLPAIAGTLDPLARSARSRAPPA